VPDTGNLRVAYAASIALFPHNGAFTERRVRHGETGRLARQINFSRSLEGIRVSHSFRRVSRHLKKFSRVLTGMLLQLTSGPKTWSRETTVSVTHITSRNNTT